MCMYSYIDELYRVKCIDVYNVQGEMYNTTIMQIVDRWIDSLLFTQKILIIIKNKILKINIH